MKWLTGIISLVAVVVVCAFLNIRDETIECPRCDRRTTPDTQQCTQCGYFIPMEERHLLFSPHLVVDKRQLEEDREHYKRNK